MYEITVALKYLTPRWRQLSVSVISLISILVISLVVWLIVVFSSVTQGLEKSWVQKMIALSAPVRVTPTEDYYHSFYYLSDSISSGSNYSLKSIGEKLASDTIIAYDPTVDEEIPQQWNRVDQDTKGQAKDLVKEMFASIRSIKGVAGIRASDFELTVGNLHLQLRKRNYPSTQTDEIDKQQQSYINQSCYLGSFESDNHFIKQSLLPLTGEDLDNIITSVVSNNDPIDPLGRCFETVCVNTLKSGTGGWVIPNDLLPYSAKFHVIAIFRQNVPTRLLLSENFQIEKKLYEQLHDYGYAVKRGHLIVNNSNLDLHLADGEIIPLSKNLPIALGPDIVLEAKLVKDSILTVNSASELKFQVRVEVQGHTLEGEIVKGNLLFDRLSYHNDQTPYWLEPRSEIDVNQKVLPSYPVGVDGVLLPRHFKSSGVLVGDTGYISYYSATATTAQEQRAPVYVAGFYDPGIMSMGGKYIITNIDLINLIRTSYENKDPTINANGVNVRFDNLKETERVKTALNKEFVKRGIDRYWKIETYKEYDYTKDLIQQLRSEKNLFTILSTIIIIVACSNIISMLIILVNDKRTEIGILRAMGASSRSIASIFGFCGVVMGLAGSVLGIIAAQLTLAYLNQIISLISQIQGHQMFNPLFYGDTLPNELSTDALFFVILATAGISLIAGIVPAIKACMVNPATILRSE